jgi:hypothetical protein
MGSGVTMLLLRPARPVFLIPSVSFKDRFVV